MGVSKNRTRVFGFANIWVNECNSDLSPIDVWALLISDQYDLILPDCLWLIFLFAVTVKGERATDGTHEAKDKQHG